MSNAPTEVKEKQHRYMIRKCKPIQFRLTQEQWEMLTKVATRYGDRPNNVARMIFLNGLRTESES